MAKSSVQEIPIIWIQAGTCTGCLVSILNSVSPTIKNVIIDELVPVLFDQKIDACILSWRVLHSERADNDFCVLPAESDAHVFKFSDEFFRCLRHFVSFLSWTMSG